MAWNQLNAVIYADGRYVGVGKEGEIFTSPDGQKFTSRPSPVIYQLNGITHDGSQFIAVGDSGTILTSAKGNVWQQRVSNSSNHLYDIAFSPTDSRYVAVGYLGEILTSTNTVDWSSVNPNPKLIR